MQLCLYTQFIKLAEIQVLLKFSDGGTDHHNNLESVKCSVIAVFTELNVDMLIGARCAPRHSWTNPAARVMSVLNIGLQTGTDRLFWKLKPS